MNHVLLTGTIIVQIALISYSIAIITEQRKHLISKNVLTFLTFAVFFDISATVFMIAGSRNTPFTIHGMIGYSALVGMLIDMILIWKQKSKSGLNSEVPKGLHLYSRFAYIWWVLAYVTGGIIAMMRV